MEGSEMLDKLSPEDNIREGVAYLGRLLKEYGDTAAAKEALVMAGGNPGCGRCAANIRTRM